MKASISMNRRDRELLNKQLQWLDPAPHGAGSMMLLIAVIFFMGVTIGTFLP